MKTCLITGVQGFIGNHVAKRLIEKGFHVVGIDRRDLKSENNNNFTFFNFDLKDINSLNLLNDFEFQSVVHLSAQTDVMTSIANPIQDAEDNYMSSVVLASYLAKRTNKCNFVYINSGGAIYGDKYVRPFVEEDQIHPLSPYGASKISGEFGIQAILNQNKDSKFCSLRLSNVYGPGTEKGLIPKLVDSSITGKEVFIFGDGSSVRDYVNVSDVCDAIMCAINSNSHGTFNISSGIGTSIMDLVNILKLNPGNKLNYRFADFREGEISISVLNNSKALSGLLWKPTMSLAQGLQEMMEIRLKDE